MALTDIAYITQQGKRDYNQDSIWPSPGSATTQDRLFLVCDGVGGSARGEVASQIVCKEFARYFELHPGTAVNHEFMRKGLAFVQGKLVDHAEKYPETAKMATTLTLVYLEEGKGAHVAWVGDSRVYHFNDSGIAFKTKDHSLVQKLIDDGDLDEKDAHGHKQKNVILRAIHANLTPVEVDYHFIPAKDLSGSSILLCTDGIIEGWDNDQLSGLMTGQGSLSSKNSTMKAQCQELSKDNFSSYLLQFGTRMKAARPSGGTNKMPLIVGTVILIAAAIIITMIMMKDEDPTPEPTEENIAEPEVVQDADADPVIEPEESDNSVNKSDSVDIQHAQTNQGGRGEDGSRGITEEDE